MRILVGLSGGVDSSVAAYLLKTQGHDVTGIMMSVWDGEYAPTGDKHACYGSDEADDIAEAEHIAKRIGIPFRVFDCAAEYRSIVVENFKSEYLSARTPNPCVRCNQRLKFGILVDAAERSGLAYDCFATGHYARVDTAESGRMILMKGTDARKDQSYFLYRLSQQQLARTLFPLGGMTKSEVRAIAREAGIPAAEKEESQDFYSGDYRELLGVNDAGGDITTADGKVIGRHGGLWNFTPGQRRGIGVASTTPLYVLRLDAETNRVIVGNKDAAGADSFIIRDTNWISTANSADVTRASVRLRSSSMEIPCSLYTENDGAVRVDLSVRSSLVAPGQSAVFYDGDIVIGGGVIDSIIT